MNNQLNPQGKLAERCEISPLGVKFHTFDWGRINASTDLPLKHTRNKLYKELVLQHLVLQLFDDSRKGSTRFVSTGIRSTKIWIYRIKFYKNRLYRK